MLKFKVTKNTVGTTVHTYTLFGKGARIGTGIAWTWVGEFPNKKYVELMKKALKDN